MGADVDVHVLAHRGSTDSSSGTTENTLAAFDRARRLGADGVELDVRLTADGALAVHHDRELPGMGLVSEVKVRQLPDHVPLLADAVAACSGMTIDIEVKNFPTEPDFDPAGGLLARSLSWCPPWRTGTLGTGSW